MPSTKKKTSAGSAAKPKTNFGKNNDGGSNGSMSLLDFFAKQTPSRVNKARSPSVGTKRDINTLNSNDTSHPPPPARIAKKICRTPSPSRKDGQGTLGSSKRHAIVIGSPEKLDCSPPPSENVVASVRGGKRPLFLPDDEDEGGEDEVIAADGGTGGLVNSLYRKEKEMAGNGSVSAKILSNDVIEIDDGEDEVEESKQSADLSCPICGRDMSSLSEDKVQTHVNRCLDQPTTSKAGTRAVSVARPRSPSLMPTSKPNTKEKPRTAQYSASSSTNSDLRILRPISSFQPELPSFRDPLPDAEDPPSRKKPDAFTALMQGHAEDKAWKRAEVAEMRGRFRPVKGAAGGGGNGKGKGKATNGGMTMMKREAPFYKIMEGMPISVDAFRYGKIEGVEAYFLTHAHADHYTNLSSSWTHGPIYCSLTTANLIKYNLGVKDKWVHALPMDTPVEVAGITVTLIDANHCPGSVLFLFEGPHTSPSSPYSSTPSRIFRYLHCGDFRASPAQIYHPALRGKRLDICYLDTTYLNPRYCFPAQELVVEACTELIRSTVLGDEGAIRRDGLGGDVEGRVKQEELMKGWLSGGGGVKKDEEPGELERGEEGDVGLGIPDLGEEEDVKPSCGGFQEDEGDGGFTMVDDSGDMDDVADDGQPETGDRDRRWTEEGLDYFADEDTGPINDQGDGRGEASVPEEVGADAMADEDIKPDVRHLIGADLRAPPDTEGVKPDVKTEMNEEAKPDVKPLVDEKPEQKRDRFLVLVGSYSVGKERIYISIAKALNSKIYCTEQKFNLLHCIDDPDLHSMLTRDPYEAQVHVTNLFGIKHEILSDYLDQFQTHYDRIIGLRPTGWTFRGDPTASIDKMPSISKILARDSKRGFSPAWLYPQRDSTWRCQAYGVPYSEHSSFYELTCFALSLNYTRMIATVNVGNATSRAKMKAWFDRWAGEAKRRKDAGEPAVVPYRAMAYW